MSIDMFRKKRRKDRAEKWVRRALIAEAFALPLSPSIATIILLFGAVFTVMRFRADDKLKFRHLPFDVPVAVFVILGAVSILFSPDRAFSFYNYYNLVGVYVLSYLFFGQNVKKPKELKEIIFAMGAAAILVVLYGYWQALFGIDATDIDWVDAEAFPELKKRVFSTWENPNILAGYLDMMLCLALGLAVKSKERAQKAALVILMVLLAGCLGLTYARGACLTIAVIFVIYGMFKDWRILFGCVLVGGAFLYYDDALLGRLLSSFSGEDSSAAMRFGIWESTVAMIEDHPFFGIGWGAFWMVYPEYDFFLQGADVKLVHAHNLYLNYAAEIGIAGALAFMWFFFGTMFKTFFANILPEEKAAPDYEVDYEKVLLWQKDTKLADLKNKEDNKEETKPEVEETTEEDETAKDSEESKVKAETEVVESDETKANDEKETAEVEEETEADVAESKAETEEDTSEEKNAEADGSAEVEIETETADSDKNTEEADSEEVAAENETEQDEAEADTESETESKTESKTEEDGSKQTADEAAEDNSNESDAEDSSKLEVNSEAEDSSKAEVNSESEPEAEDSSKSENEADSSAETDLEVADVANTNVEETTEDNSTDDETEESDAEVETKTEADEAAETVENAAEEESAVEETEKEVAETNKSSKPNNAVELYGVMRPKEEPEEPEEEAEPKTFSDYIEDIKNWDGKHLRAGVALGISLAFASVALNGLTDDLLFNIPTSMLFWSLAALGAVTVDMPDDEEAKK